jgi:hypothetical protein
MAIHITHIRKHIASMKATIADSKAAIDTISKNFVDRCTFNGYCVLADHDNVKNQISRHRNTMSSMIPFASKIKIELLIKGF